MDGAVVAQLGAAGNALYRPEGSALPAAASSIQQGMLEQSNVSAVEGMVELITVQRNAEMMQRAISLFDSQRSTTPPKTPRPRFPDLTPKTAPRSSWARAPHFPKALPSRADKWSVSPSRRSSAPLRSKKGALLTDITVQANWLALLGRGINSGIWRLLA